MGWKKLHKELIEESRFWDSISDSVREYLSMKYYAKTRCLLNQEEILDIVKQERSLMLSIKIKTDYEMD